jgi:hypothetical protein
MYESIHNFTAKPVSLRGRKGDLRKGDIDNAHKKNAKQAGMRVLK